jgi:hypothetical protein
MEEILKLINAFNWSEGFYKGGFLVMGFVVLYAGYHGLKIFGKRSLEILNSLQSSVKELMTISQKQDTRIQLVEQEQKFQNQKLVQHDERLETLMQHLIEIGSR